MAKAVALPIRHAIPLMLTALVAAAIFAVTPAPAEAAQSRFSKAELCQVLYPCEAPARYQAGGFLKKPRIVAVSMPKVQAICAGHQTRAARGGDFPYTVMGCAELRDTECVIHISPSLKQVSGQLYDLVLAHELAHCRGWRH